MQKSHIKVSANGEIEGVLFHGLETANIVDGAKLSVVAFTYARDHAHAAEITARRAQPEVIQGFITPDNMRAYAALLLRAADAVDGKPETKN